MPEGVFAPPPTARNRFKKRSFRTFWCVGPLCSDFSGLYPRVVLSVCLVAWNIDCTGLVSRVLSTNFFRITLIRRWRKSRSLFVSLQTSAYSPQPSTSAQWMRRWCRWFLTEQVFNTLFSRSRKTGSPWGQAPLLARFMNWSLCFQTTRISGD